MVKPILCVRTANKMMYRKHHEYHQPLEKHDIEILKRWLKGETGNDSLKIWLNTLYN